MSSSTVTGSSACSPTSSTTRFATARRAPPSTSSWLAADESTVQITVRDHGPGIDSGVLPHIFEAGHPRNPGGRQRRHRSRARPDDRKAPARAPGRDDHRQNHPTGGAACHTHPPASTCPTRPKRAVPRESKLRLSDRRRSTPRRLRLASCAPAMAWTIGRPSPSPSLARLSARVESVKRFEETAGAPLAGMSGPLLATTRSACPALRAGRDLDPAAGDVVPNRVRDEVRGESLDENEVAVDHRRLEHDDALEPAPIVGVESLRPRSPQGRSGRDASSPQRLRARVRHASSSAFLLEAGVEDILGNLSPGGRVREWVRESQLEQGALRRQGRTQLVGDIGGKVLLDVRLGGLARRHHSERRPARQARRPRYGESWSGRRSSALGGGRPSAGTAVGQTRWYQLPANRQRAE